MACAKELLGLESLQNAELVAGRKGLYRTISWPNVAQTVSIREWLVGGDVIIITGIGIECTAEGLQGILTQALEAHSGCLLVYLSDMYIRDIPDEVLAMADESKFPVFTTPWNTLIADIVRDISQLLLIERYQSESMNSLIKELVFRSDTVPSELLLAFIKQQRLTTDHVVAVAEWLGDQEFGEGFQQSVFIRQEGTNLLIQELLSAFSQVLYVDHQQYTYFIIRIKRDQMDALTGLCTKLCANLRLQHPRFHVRMGIGQIYDDPLRFYLSATEARKALGLSRFDREVVCFDELGLYQLLCKLPDQSQVQDFAISRLQPLLDHDLKSGKNFLNTLEVFLFCNCNAKQTAQQLYIHRNTLAYQLEQIQKLLNVDMEDAEVRNTLFNCLKIYHYCQK